MAPDHAGPGSVVAGSVSRVAAASDDDLAGIETYASLVVMEFGAGNLETERRMTTY